MKHILEIAIVIVLCAATLLCSIPVAAFAPKEYVSDIKLVSINKDNEKSRNAAIKELTDAGYEVAYSNWGNLNAGADGGCCYIGYKTTTDPTKALTDIRAMDENGGYVKTNYDGLNEGTKQKVEDIVKGFMTAAAETRLNHMKGSPAAKYAIESLNLLEYPGKGALGTAFINQTLSADDYKEIVEYANPSMLSTVFNLLMTGCSDYDPNYVRPDDIPEDELHIPYTWLARTSELPASTRSPASYSQEADLFANSIRRTGEKVFDTKAKLAKLEEEELNKLSSSEGSQDEAFERAMARLDETDKLYLSIEEILNQYEFNVAKPLLDSQGNIQTDDYGNEILSDEYELWGIGEMLWDCDDLSELDFSWCYPVYLAMTPGQRAMLPFCGIEYCMGTLNNTTEALEASRSKRTEALAKAGIDSQKRTSVFDGVDRDAIRQDVFMTDQAARSYAYQQEVAALSKYDSFDRGLYDALQWVSIAFGFVAIIDISLLITSYVTGITLTLSAFSAALTAGSGMTFGLAVAGIAGIANYVLLAVTVCILLVMLVGAIVKWIDGLIHTYDAMPRVIYDVQTIKKEDAYIRYELATTPKGKEADLNAFCSKIWLALYSTKDPKAGNPILANSFRRQEGDGKTAAGYTPVCLFGSGIAINTNFQTDDDDRGGLYLFFRQDGGPKDKVLEHGKYLRSLKIWSGDNESILKKAAESSTSEPFLLNQNLTPGNGFTFLAYSTTDESSLAIKDIRVAYGLNPENQDKFRIGNANYSNAGFSKGVSYLSSIINETGYPILADSLYVTSSFYLEGYESVCHISGGPAFNLNIGAVWDYNDDTYQLAMNLHPVHLLYQFEEENRGTEEYVSGIAKIHMSDGIEGRDETWTTNQIEGYAASLGYMTIPGTITVENDNQRRGRLDISCYGYSVTQNYKRALGDIIVADSDVNMKNIPYVPKGDSIYMSIPSPMLLKWRSNKVSSKNLSEIGDMYYASKSFYSNDSGEIESSAKARVSDQRVPGIFVAPAVSEENAIKRDGFGFTTNLSEASFRQAIVAMFENAKLNTDKVSYYAVDAVDSDKPGYVEGKYLILLKRGPAKEEKYVSGVSIFDENREESQGVAYSKLLSSNVCKSFGHLYVEDGCYPQGDTHFIEAGVTKSSRSTDALTDVKLVVFSYKDTPPAKMIINDIPYELSSKDPLIYLNNDSACWDKAMLYVTKSPKAGPKITSLYVEEVPPMNGDEMARFIDKDSKEDALDKLWGMPDYFLFIKREVENSYIEDIGVVYYLFGNVDEDDYREIVSRGTTRYHTNVIDKDLNSRAGGEYMNLTYKRTWDSSKAITGLKLLCGERKSPKFMFIDGVFWYQVNSLDCPDLNMYAGGEYLYLYYTKDPRVGPPLTNLNVKLYSERGERTYLSSGYQWVKWFFSDNKADFNFDAGGDYVYVEYEAKRRVGNVVASLFVELSREGMILSCFAVAVMLGTFITFSFKKRKRSKAH